MTATYAIRTHVKDGEVEIEEVPPSEFVTPEHRGNVLFSSKVFQLRKARVAASVELLKEGEVLIRAEQVTPEDKFIEFTRSVPGHGHTQLWGRFHGPVTEADIKEEAFGYFGGRDLRIDWFNKTFFCIRHDD